MLIWPATVAIARSNDCRRKRKTPSRTIAIATVPIAVTAIVRLRVKFWATSAQKKRTLPQSNVVASLLFVVRDASVDETHDAPAHAIDDRLVVRRDDDGRALRVDAREERHDLARGLGIEISGRLVAQEDERIVDERSRDRRALLLAAGQFVREHLALVRDADEVEHARHATQHVARARARHLERVRDVLPDRLLMEQTEVLEDDADFAAEHRDLSARHPR